MIDKPIPPPNQTIKEGHDPVYRTNPPRLVPIDIRTKMTQLKLSDFRIKVETQKDGSRIYFPQKRVDMFFFDLWKSFKERKGISTFRAHSPIFDVWFISPEEAKEFIEKHIREKLMKKSKEYIYL